MRSPAFAAVAWGLFFKNVYAANPNYSSHVNLFIGTQGTAAGTSYNGGNVFPGAALPFGVVKVGIDTTE